MKLFGSITYDWHGTTVTAVASPPGQKTPDVIIRFDPRWVAVGRVVGGTQLVAWESIRSLSGWSPLPERQQDSASDAEPHVSRDNTGSAGVERPMRRPIGGRNDG